jgi:hypothetical protein
MLYVVCGNRPTLAGTATHHPPPLDYSPSPFEPRLGLMSVRNPEQNPAICLLHLIWEPTVTQPAHEGHDYDCE